jgi:hypothetical protein
MPSVALNSKWFQSYSRAVLESDPNVARTYLKIALDVINETLKQSDLENDERTAISSAVHFLQLIEHLELQKGFLTAQRRRIHMATAKRISKKSPAGKAA